MKTLRKRFGQSLLEMMIALSMLTVAFLGIATLLTRSFFLNRVATDETVGSYLAAEGIEVTKSIIDHDVYGTGLTWGVDVPAGNYSPTATTTTFLSGGAPKSTATLKFDPTSHYYQYATGDATPFVRTVNISIPNKNEIDVLSTVTWSTGSLAGETITDEDHFYDWHP